MKLIALPDVQETSDVPCDTGSDPGVLEKEFVEKGLPVDLELLEDGWNNKFVSFEALALSVCVMWKGDDANE